MYLLKLDVLVEFMVIVSSLTNNFGYLVIVIISQMQLKGPDIMDPRK